LGSITATFPKEKLSQPQQTEPNAAQQRPAIDQRGTDQMPLTVKILPAQKTEPDTTAEREEHEEKAALDRRLVLFNGLLIVVGSLQFLAISVQAIFLWLAFKQSRRPADIARDAMVAGERAFVFAIDVFPMWEIDPVTGNHNWRFRPIWKNSGDTPTGNMTMHTECELPSSQLPPGFDFNYPTTQIGTALIPPGTTCAGSIAPRLPSLAITPQDILDMQAGRKILYFWGWAKYRDVFPNTPDHITRFCWMIVSTGTPLTFVSGQVSGQPNALNFASIHHTEGNCADDECA
jgi:hypothetical protein